MNAMISKVAALAIGLTLATPALAARVDRREARQQARIAQGIRTGALTPREAVRLERKEAKLHVQVQTARASGGHLTPAERAKFEARQDRLSRAIYREKHDRQVR